MINIPGYRPIKPYKEEYLFTLDDLFSNVLKIDYKPYESSFFYLLYTGTIPAATFTSMSEDYLKELSGLIYLKWSKFYVFSYPKDNPTEIARSSKLIDWKRRLFGILMATYTRYSTMLGIYSNNLNQLMDAIKTSVKGDTKFNDTPQDEGNFSGNEYTTTITKVGSETSYDGGTKISKIDEIQKRIRDLYEDWSNEFEKLFINPLNVL